jgi:hypothetical protein
METNKPADWALKIAQSIEDNHLKTKFCGNGYTGEGVDYPCLDSVEDVARLIESAAEEALKK